MLVVPYLGGHREGGADLGPLILNSQRFPGTPEQKRAEEALERSPYFEFDIVLNPKLKAQVFSSQRWPSGIVPYVIEGSFSEYKKSGNSLLSTSWYST